MLVYKSKIGKNVRNNNFGSIGPKHPNETLCKMSDHISISEWF